MKFICTMEIHIARGNAEGNMNFQSANKFHIALTQRAVFSLLHDNCVSSPLIGQFPVNQSKY